MLKAIARSLIFSFLLCLLGAGGGAAQQVIVTFDPAAGLSPATQDVARKEIAEVLLSRTVPPGLEVLPKLTFCWSFTDNTGRYGPRYIEAMLRRAGAAFADGIDISRCDVAEVVITNFQILRPEILQPEILRPQLPVERVDPPLPPRPVPQPPADTEPPRIQSVRAEFICHELHAEVVAIDNVGVRSVALDGRLMETADETRFTATVPGEGLRNGQIMEVIASDGRNSSVPAPVEVDLYPYCGTRRDHSSEIVADVQLGLSILGLDPQGIDGTAGRGTCAAIERFLQDSYPPFCHGQWGWLDLLRRLPPVPQPRAGPVPQGLRPPPQTTDRLLRVGAAKPPRLPPYARPAAMPVREDAPGLADAPPEPLPPRQVIIIIEPGPRVETGDARVSLRISLQNHRPGDRIDIPGAGSFLADELPMTVQVDMPPRGQSAAVQVALVAPNTTASGGRVMLVRTAPVVPTWLKLAAGLAALTAAARWTPRLLLRPRVRLVADGAPVLEHDAPTLPAARLRLEPDANPQIETIPPTLYEPET